MPSVPVAADRTSVRCLRRVLSRYIRLSAVAKMASCHPHPGGRWRRRH
jgi:hypothetical protein